MNEEEISLIIKNKRKCYFILGVAHDAPAESIRRAYYKKVIRLHPDKVSGEAAGEACRAVNNAYETLMNDDSRRNYDLLGGDDRPEEYTLWSSLLVFFVSISPMIAKYMGRSVRRESLSRKSTVYTFILALMLLLALWGAETLGNTSVKKREEGAWMEFPIFQDCLRKHSEDTKVTDHSALWISPSLRESTKKAAVEASLACHVLQRTAAQSGAEDQEAAANKKDFGGIIEVEGAFFSEEEGARWHYEALWEKCRYEQVLHRASRERYQPTSTLPFETGKNGQSASSSYVNPNRTPKHIPPRQTLKSWERKLNHTEMEKLAFTVKTEKDLFHYSPFCQWIS